MKKTLFPALVAMLTVQALTAQTKKSYTEAFEKNSISVNILGSASYLGVTYERVFFQRLVAEVGMGIIGLGAGVTVYPLKKLSPRQINFFTGLKLTRHTIVDGENKAVVYIPFGISFHAQKNISLSADIGPAYNRHIYPGHFSTQPNPRTYPYSNSGVFGNIKLSFRFGK